MTMLQKKLVSGMVKYFNTQLGILFIEILRVSKFIIQRRLLVTIYISIVITALVLNFLAFSDFKSNRQFYYEFRDQPSCNIEIYSVLKLLKIIKWSYLLVFFMTCFTWYYIDKKESIRLSFLPIKPSIYVLSTLLFHCLYYVIIGFLFLLEINLEWNDLLSSAEWTQLPIGKFETNQIIWLSNIFFLGLNSVVILSIKYFTNNHKWVPAALILLLFVASNYLLPFNRLISDLNTYCKIH